MTVTQTAADAAENKTTTTPAIDLAPVAGIVDLTSRDGGFVRTAGFRVSGADVSVPASLIRRYGLRRGDQITGAARPRGTTAPKATAPKAGTAKAGIAKAGSQPDSRGGRNRDDQNRARAAAAVLERVDTINGRPAAEAAGRPHFDRLTPLYAQQRLRLEDGSASPTARIIDLVAPIGKGQRGLIVSPPKAGKTTVLTEIAAAISAAHPEVHLMLVLVGERPEEVTDIKRSVRGEVVFSTFDRSAEDHIMVAELAIERAKRLVEGGRDVVVLLDSITRLARAYNLAAPASSRILAGGVATSALQPPRAFLGAARNIEEGGSLTILSTALIDNGSRMDDVFFEEFKGTGNAELRLRRDLAEKRVYPAVDVTASGTRREDLLLNPDEYTAVVKLRRGLASLDSQQSAELLLERVGGTATNAEFLRQVGGAGVNGTGANGTGANGTGVSGPRAGGTAR